MQASASTPRRSTRTKKLSIKAIEQLSLNSPKKFNTNREVSNDDSDDEFIEIEEREKEKPKILHENETVEGERIFSFQTRKTRTALLQKASQVCEQIPKTPHSLRNKIRKRIQDKILEENDSSESDYSESDTEYVGSSSASESEDSLETTQSSENELQKVTKHKKKLVATQKENYKTVDKKYTIRTDDYFSNHASKRILTSNHTLDKLETPRLPQDQLQKLLSKVDFVGEHQTEIDDLLNSNQSCFNKWLYLLHENFNVLLYGLGSKKQTLDLFHEEYLKDKHVIIINGFFPSITVKDVLDSIIVELLEIKENPSNISEAIDLIEREFNYIPNSHLYLIVHNIEMLRGGKIQNVFAKLASLRNIHLIASIDHINAPLSWDHSKLSKFKFSWWDVTSFQPYLIETSFESSMMVQGSGTLALSSLRNVFLSLTKNSKGIYSILVKHQLENVKNQYYQGLSFKELYSLCREEFLVSSDLALRAQLTEFIDHKMVKCKRSPDGTEYLTIPVSSALLQQFCIEQFSFS